MLDYDGLLSIEHYPKFSKSFQFSIRDRNVPHNLAVNGAGDTIL